MTLGIHMFVPLWISFPEELKTKQDQINKLTEDLLVKNKRLYDPFLWIGFNCLKALEPIVGDSLLLTTRSHEFLVLT